MHSFKQYLTTLEGVPRGKHQSSYISTEAAKTCRPTGRKVFLSNRHIHTYDVLLVGTVVIRAIVGKCPALHSPVGLFSASCPLGIGGGTICVISVHAIRVKWTPKPDPVKPRPPTARRFYFTKPAVPWVYIFVTSHVLAHVANAPPVAAYPRYPPRRFVSFPSAAPTAPSGSAFLASPGCHRGHLDLDEP